MCKYTHTHTHVYIHTHTHKYTYHVPCQENTLVIPNTIFQQHKRRLHMDYPQMINTVIRLITFFAAEDEETIQSAKTRLRADCGSDHELLIAKFRIKSMKVGKTTSLFRYDLNQIPYDYTVEVMSRLKG